MGKQVILSPHFDDAVFSCWQLINQQGSEVVTIFAGIPPSKTATLWDRLCGQSSSVQMMRNRAEENKSALKGITTHNLDHLDKQYRSREKPNISEITNNILQEVSPESHFFVPLAYSMLWRHPDHISVREVGRYLLSQGKKVSFYVDIPYMWMPSVVSKNYQKRLNGKLYDIFGMNFSAQIYKLSQKEQTAKLEAMMKYGSQYKMTNLISLGTLKRKANLEHEVCFSPLN